MARTRKKAVHGSGSVYPRKDGRWVAKFRVEATGRYKELYARTEKEAYEKLEAALFEQRQGRLATGPRQKLKDYLEDWFEHVHTPKIRKSTYVRHRIMLQKYIIPALGHLQMQKLTPQQIQAFYSSMLSKNLAPRTVLNTHGLLHKALENAVRWRLIPRNVCDDVTPPTPRSKEAQSLTIEQARTLFEAAKGHTLEAMLTLALGTGMRHGELRGLRWRDVNLEEGYVHIRRTVSYIGGYGYLEDEPKTAKGRRKILLPAFIMELLKQHRLRQLEMRLQAGGKWREHDLVFCNQTGGYLHPDVGMKQFRRLLKDAGLPLSLRIHDLRHSAATIFLSMGVHPKVVQELLGHSQISMTMDIYSHALPSMQQDAMTRLNDLFQPPMQDDDRSAPSRK